MKKYIKPSIKAVELLGEQAILEVCQVGGGWFGGGTNSFCEPYHSYPETFASSCTFSVRGVAKGYNWFEATLRQNQPS
ncbi:MAG: hypothetical protein PHQ52_07075 [Candidatus Omnitrophica bacterium]|nr:hypothetical protein [Candidatus Omnitrophota bacterium]